MRGKGIALIIITFMGLSLSLSAQTRLSWSSLEACDTPSGRIEFTDEIEALDNQLVRIKGFMIPLDTDGEEYALSAYPMSECFFCGNAGPSSMLELHLVNPKRYSLDAYKSFTGRLTLSPASQGLVFTLEEAEES